MNATSQGLGVGNQLVQPRLRFARRAGYQRLRLWTNDVLVSARRSGEAAGSSLTDEESHHSFSQDLAGQNREFEL